MEKVEAPTSNFALVDRVKRGDSDAFSELFARHRRRLAVFLHYKLGPELHAEVDDLLQETFLRAFRDIASFRYQGPESFWNWLAAIAGHAVIDAARHAGRQKRHAELLRFRSAGNPDGPDPLDSRTPSRMLADREAVQRLLDRLNALPADYREAILLAKVEGLSTAEMALRLDRSREAAALLLHRALKRFRAAPEES